MDMSFLNSVAVDAPSKVVLTPPGDLVMAGRAAEQALAEHRASGGEFNGPDPVRLNELKQVFCEASAALFEAALAGIASSGRPKWRRPCNRSRKAV